MALRACCASPAWVERMLSQRPFKDRDEVFAAAEHIWWEVGPEEWLAAFAAHPQIGGQAVRRSGGQEQHAAAWAAGEQARVADASAGVKAELAAANREYEAKFGFIYIVCATGKSADDMLASCRRRLTNDRDTELRIAAAEQLAITKLRLEKLLTL